MTGHEILLNLRQQFLINLPPSQLDHSEGPHTQNVFHTTCARNQQLFQEAELEL